MEYYSQQYRDDTHQSLLQELEATKEQLKKQIKLKEMYINRGKETTRELERLRKYSNDEAISHAKIATQVRDTNRQKKKKELHKDYEELQVAQLVNEEKFQTDLQAEKDKNKLLQKDLDKISVSHNEISLRYETDVIKVRQQVATLQHDLVKEMQQKTTVEKQYAELQMAHELSQDMFKAELQVEKDKNKLLHIELDRISISQQEISQRHSADVNAVIQQSVTLQHELQAEVQQRKLLQKEQEELKKAQTSSHEKFTAELQVEKDKNKLLQKDLDEISVSHNEIRLRYETDVIKVREQVDTLQGELQKEVQQRQLLQQEHKELKKAQTSSLETAKLDRNSGISQSCQTEVKPVRQQADSLQWELEKEVKSHADTVSKGLQMITNLRAEQDDLRHRKTETLNLDLSTELKALKDTEVSEEKLCEQESIATALAPELVDVTLVSEENHPGKTKKTVWKRIRNSIAKSLSPSNINTKDFSTVGSQ